MKKITKRLLILLFAAVLSAALMSCDGGSAAASDPADGTDATDAADADTDEGPAPVVPLDPEEDFGEGDAPETYTIESFTVKGPWGYGKAANAARKYPLLVVGCWGEGSGEYAAFEKRHPAFVLDYQKYTETDGQSLALWLGKAIAAGYRIDVNRIYLTGFSQGGSGSFPLAIGMKKGGRYFAAINRVAGQSQPDLTNEIAARTALWYHLGLSDTQQRIDVARDTLENFRGYACNSTAIETKSSDTVAGYARETIRLRRGDFDMFIYSEYSGLGHSSGPCYKDTRVFPWMFSHSLAIR